MEGLAYIAALILVGVAMVHSYLGERFILIRLFKRDNLPKLFGSDDFTKKTLRFAWHLTSVAWLGFAAIVVMLVQPDLSKRAIALAIVTTFAVHFVVALLGSRGKHLSWLAFLLISVTSFFALR